MIEQLAEMPTYEAYKDSGVEWIGEIPAHWDSTSSKRLLEMPITDGPHSTPQLFDEGIPFISAEAIKNGVINFDSKRGYISEKDYQEFSKKYVPRRNDVYMVKSGATTGRVAKVETDEKFTIWSPLAVFRSKKTILQYGFLYYFLSSPPFQKGIELSWSFGTQQNIGMGVLGNLPVCYPPLSEQTAIAAFLDRKTAQLDQAVAIKEQQIALLKEHKQILIQTAVTRGLDPNVTMRDSGVEWIGEIPAHWEIRRSKFVFTQRKELAKPGDVQLSATQAYGVIPQDEYESKIDRRVVKIQFHLEKRKHVEIDDFVISMRSFQGGLERAWSEGCIRSSYVVLKPLIELSASYYGYLFKSSRYISALQSTANFIRDGQDLNFENFSMVDLPIAPLDEQCKIASYLDNQICLVNKSTELLQQQIDKLKEYKATLINSAVTGKIRVPEIAA